jgi:hypothetical protein
VRAARFAETALKHFVRSFQKEYEDIQPVLVQRLKLCVELGEEMSLAYIYDQRGALDPGIFVLALFDQPGEGRQERDRQVIDAEVAQVFKGIRSRRHAGAAEARNDDYVGRVAAFTQLFIIHHLQPCASP